MTKMNMLFNKIKFIFILISASTYLSSYTEKKLSVNHTKVKTTLLRLTSRNIESEKDLDYYYWIQCARESRIPNSGNSRFSSEFCKVNKPTIVKYGQGALGNWTYKEVSTDIQCNSRTFLFSSGMGLGSCLYLDNKDLSTENSWKLCANEGSECVIDVMTMVKFGTESVNSNNILKQMGKTFTCNAASFGAPSNQSGKNCYILRAYWNIWCQSNENCKFEGNKYLDLI